ncbi:DNA-damage inducible protein DDI1-like protein [Vairimorpha necatrix]|uniref:DNA-damage inducible protein DDI1-like protein n=1 Tax=Vairimorpha necatrix TaxID=6039 RepID=A0AAX4JEW7_9MICR
MKENSEPEKTQTRENEKPKWQPKRKVLNISATVRKENDNRPRLQLTGGEHSLEAFIATGATVSVIKRKESTNMGMRMTKTAGKIRGLSGIQRCWDVATFE